MTIKIENKTWSVALFDLLTFVIVYYIPALTHITPIPFYIVEPFRLIVLFSLILFGNRRNALFLAITLPLFSYILANHPLFAKSFLISSEMIFNILIYDYLKKWKNHFVCILISIVFSKVGYYLLKYCFISMGLLSMSLVSTSFLIQLIVAVVTALLFSQFKNKSDYHD